MPLMGDTSITELCKLSVFDPKSISAIDDYECGVKKVVLTKTLYGRTVVTSIAPTVCLSDLSAFTEEMTLLYAIKQAASTDFLHWAETDNLPWAELVNSLSIHMGLAQL